MLLHTLYLFRHEKNKTKLKKQDKNTMKLLFARTPSRLPIILPLIKLTTDIIMNIVIKTIIAFSISVIPYQLYIGATTTLMFHLSFCILRPPNRL